MTKFKEFWIFFGVQCFLYCLLVINYRSVVEVNYAILAATDFIIASANFFVISKIAKATESLHQWAGYAFGGAIGGVLGLWIDKYM